MKKSGDNIKVKNAAWSFDGSTYKNFNKHIKKSVPLYKETHDLYLNFSGNSLSSLIALIKVSAST